MKKLFSLLVCLLALYTPPATPAAHRKKTIYKEWTDLIPAYRRGKETVFSQEGYSQRFYGQSRSLYAEFTGYKTISPVDGSDPLWFLKHGLEKNQETKYAEITAYKYILEKTKGISLSSEDTICLIATIILIAEVIDYAYADYNTTDTKKQQAFTQYAATYREGNIVTRLTKQLQILTPYVTKHRRHIGYDTAGERVLAYATREQTEALEAVVEKAIKAAAEKRLSPGRRIRRRRPGARASRAKASRAKAFCAGAGSGAGAGSKK